MKVTATRAVYVEVDGKKVVIDPGQSADVDGRKYGESHPFIVEGYLVAEKAPEKPRRKAKAEPVVEPEPESDEEDPA